MREKRFYFSFSVTLTFDLRSQICSTSYSCPALCFH